jgi:hypothetical protein
VRARARADLFLIDNLMDDNLIDNAPPTHTAHAAAAQPPLALANGGGASLLDDLHSLSLGDSGLGLMGAQQLQPQPPQHSQPQQLQARQSQQLQPSQPPPPELFNGLQFGLGEAPNAPPPPPPSAVPAASAFDLSSLQPGGGLGAMGAMGATEGMGGMGALFEGMQVGAQPVGGGGGSQLGPAAGPGSPASGGFGLDGLCSPSTPLSASGNILSPSVGGSSSGGAGIDQLSAPLASPSRGAPMAPMAASHQQMQRGGGMGMPRVRARDAPEPRAPLHCARENCVAHAPRASPRFSLRRPDSLRRCSRCTPCSRCSRWR